MFGPLLLSALLSVGADTALTHVVLQRGGREVVLSQNPYVNDAIGAGLGASVAFTLPQLHKTHPKLAVTIAVVILVSRSLAATHNAQLLINGPTIRR